MSQTPANIHSPVRDFTIHTIESAPEKSKPMLQGLKQNFGFIPNAAATMAGSPALIGAFVGAFGNFHGSSLSEAEKQVVLLTNAVTLRCAWTVAFHSTMAQRAEVDASDIAAIREGRLPGDPKHAALSRIARALIEKHGHLGDDYLGQFSAAGYSPSQVFDVIAGIAISTMAALTSSLAQTPVEERFQAQVWCAASA